MTDEVCIHDGGHNGQSEDHDGRRVSETWCAQCGALLHSKSMDLTSLVIRKTIHNDVYRELYTQEGRMALLRFVIEDKYGRCPEVWS